MYGYEIMIMVNICLLDSQKLGERIEKKYGWKHFLVALHGSVPYECGGHDFDAFVIIFLLYSTCGRYTDLILDMIANRLTADQVCSALDLCQVRVASQGYAYQKRWHNLIFIVNVVNLIVYKNIIFV